MIINEEKQIINFSDHNLVSLELKLKPTIRGEKCRMELIIYYKKDQSTLNNFIRDLRGRWREGMSY